MSDVIELTRKDFVSDQTVRWCPGCGDYAILAQIQRVLPDLGTPKENIVFVSGIGCSSRFPYYMNTYGIHSIHGRAPTLATGLKLANPNLQVWVITGDGDGLSIGGNHLIHAIRRNIDINIILFNNRIYGLTKGQYSPTSVPGTKTKSSPMGSLEQAFNPISVAIGVEATFVARTVDSNVKHMAQVLREAAAHKGTSFVEIYQNCVIFNDKTWEYASDRKQKADNVIELNHGKPLIFGKDKDKAIRLKGLQPEIVNLDEVDKDELLIHDKNSPKPNLAYLLSQMTYPEFPEPIGIFRSIEKETYERGVLDQVETAKKQKGKGDLATLYHASDTWNVPADDKSPSRNGKGSSDVPSEHDDEYTGTVFHGEGSSEPYELSKHILADLNPQKPLIASVDISLAEAVKQLQDLNVGLVALVDDDKKLVGVFTEGDVFHRVACQVEDLSQEKVRDYMTSQVTTLKFDSTISYAVNLMSAHNFRHILLVDDEYRPNGVLSFRAVSRYLEKSFSASEQE